MDVLREWQELHCSQSRWILDQFQKLLAIWVTKDAKTWDDVIQVEKYKSNPLMSLTWGELEGVLQYLTSQWNSVVVNLVWLPEVPFPSSHLTSFPQKKAHTNSLLIFTEFYFIMLQTMTSRYIDTQLLLCVYVRLWVYVYVCVKRAVRPQKAEWKSRVREPSMG